MVIPACRVSMASPTAPGKRLRACGRRNNSTLPRGRLCGRSGGARRLHPRSATAKHLSLSLFRQHTESHVVVNRQEKYNLVFGIFKNAIYK